MLTSPYKVSRADVVDQLVRFVRKATIKVLAADKGIVVAALLLCRGSGQVSFADALI